MTAIAIAAGGGDGVRLTLQAAGSLAINPANPDISVNRAGTVTCGSTPLGAGNHDWIFPTSSTVGDAWEVFASIVSGTVESGTTGSWLALSTNRAWSKSIDGTCELDVSIGRAGTSTALITKRLTLQRTV